MANFTAVYDACVLYSAPVRDLLIRLGGTGLFRARWTDQIHDEWTNALQKKRKDIEPAKIARTRELVNQAIPDCLVTGYEGLIEGLKLPDPNDRHVLAAAIVCQAGVIVTYDLKDFPADALGEYEIEAQHPDEFVSHLLDLAPAVVCEVVRQQREALTNPAVSPEQFVERLSTLEFTKTATQLEEMVGLL